MITSVFAVLQNTENRPGKALKVSCNPIFCPRTESVVAKVFLTRLLYPFKKKKISVIWILKAPWTMYYKA